MKTQLIVSMAVFILGTGCSFDRLARRQMTRTTLDIVSVYDSETDLELARTTLAVSLKLLEGAMKSDSDNTALLTAAARGYSRYSWGFLEPEIEQSKWKGDSASVSEISKRAVKFYKRSKGFGYRALISNNTDFINLETRNINEFKRWLDQLDSIQAEALYWTAFAWGNLLRFKTSFSNLPNDLAKVRMMMEQVIHLADSCYIGQAHTFLGAYYASLPPVLGKDMNLAKSYLEKGVSISQGNFLPARLAYARYFQLLSGDQNGYRIVLQAIIDAPQSENQSQALDNAVAQEQAKTLLLRFEELIGTMGVCEDHDWHAGCNACQRKQFEILE